MPDKDSSSLVESTSNKRGPSSSAPPRNDELAKPDTQGGQEVLPAAYGEYVKRIGQATTRLQQRYTDECNKYASAVADAQRDVQQTCDEAGHRYVGELKEVWGPTDLATRTAAALQRLTDLAQELSTHGGVQGGVQEAYAAFVGSTARVGPADAGNSAKELHRAYLEAIQKAWGLAETQKRAAEAHAEYLVLFGDLQRERGQRSYEAYSAYLKNVTDAIDAANLPMRTDTAFESSLSALQDEWKRAYEEQAEASLQALKSLQAPPESGK